MLHCKTSYLDEAEVKQDVSPDEAAGPAEAGKTSASVKPRRMGTAHRQLRWA